MSSAGIASSGSRSSGSLAHRHKTPSSSQRPSENSSTPHIKKDRLPHVSLTLLGLCNCQFRLCAMRFFIRLISGIAFLVNFGGVTIHFISHTDCKSNLTIFFNRDPIVLIYNIVIMFKKKMDSFKLSLFHPLARQTNSPASKSCCLAHSKELLQFH